MLHLLDRAQGGMFEVDKLHDTVDATGIDESQLESVQRERRAKAAKAAKIQGEVQDDWAWAP
eukprot:SAG22_NODE_5044_length_1101_cov_1.889222_1_plen_61_part_10